MKISQCIAYGREGKEGEESDIVEKANDGEFINGVDEKLEKELGVDGIDQGKEGIIEDESE